ncbi:hypothetical protein ACQ4PT_002848 [Festuca glaucescens]
MLMGGAALDAVGVPLPDETLAAARASDGILLGAIGGYKWDANEKHLKPETGLLDIRAGLGVFANLRPVTVFPQLVDASPLKKDIAEGVDIMVVRELTGGIYFGRPRGFGTNDNGEETGFNTEIYSVSEIDRIARVAFEVARKRGGKLCSVDKANVLEASMLWRKRVTAIASEFPDVELSHMYVDNAAMQLVRNPKQFDTIVTNNIFGDILSDEASMITGSIGMLSSASVGESGPGLFEPIHGSAPDIAGQDKANPIATILSGAMLLKYGLGAEDAAKRIETAVAQTLDNGFRTGDIYSPGTTLVGCKRMGMEVLKALESHRRHRREEEGGELWEILEVEVSPPRLGKTYVPDFKLKIHDFSALLETKATSAISVPFDLSGYKWYASQLQLYLQVSPMHKKNNDETPYVALALILWPYMLEQGLTVHAVFKFSIYDHSNRMYCGCKADYNFDFKNNYSKKECLIPLQELLKWSSFLVDDSCVFGVEILKIDVSSPERKEVVVQHKATTVQNFFVQKKGFVEGTYTWTVNNFHELELKNFFCSPTFEVGGHKWYICMYPRGDRCSTDCLSLHLCLDAPNDLPRESKNVAKMTLSIQDQKNGKHVTITTGSALLSNYSLVVFRGSWGWPNFIPLKKFKDPSGGYLVESNCVVKADLTIVGSSNDG